jgi:hypothetical protein
MSSKWLFSSGFPKKIVCISYFVHARQCLIHLIAFDLIILITFGEFYGSGGLERIPLCLSVTDSINAFFYNKCTYLLTYLLTYIVTPWCRILSLRSSLMSSTYA